MPDRRKIHRSALQDAEMVLENMLSVSDQLIEGEPDPRSMGRWVSASTEVFTRILDEAGIECSCRKPEPSETVFAVRWQCTCEAKDR